MADDLSDTKEGVIVVTKAPVNAVRPKDKEPINDPHARREQKEEIEIDLSKDPEPNPPKQIKPASKADNSPNPSVF